MKKLLALIVLTGFSYCAQECKNITFEWGFSKDFDKAEAVFIKSFSEAYKEIPLEILKVKSVKSFLQDAFAEELVDLKDSCSNCSFS